MVKNIKIQNELMAVLFAASRIMRERVFRKHKPNPGSFLQFGALKYIQMKGEVRMKELSNFLRITPGTLTALIDRLDRQGLVKRVIGETDRRHKYLRATKKSEKLLAEHFYRMKAEIQGIVSHLSEQSQKQLIKILKELIYRYQVKNK